MGWMVVLLSGSVAVAQQASWVVKPAWVQAHEDFLASDVMHGRGSATRDEQITATYVASEFMEYGLKTAPGMSGYIQSAEVISPELAGNAMLRSGALSLSEGNDFDLLISPATDASGQLQVVAYNNIATAKIERGAAVLVTGADDPNDALRAYSGARRKGASLVLLVKAAGTENLLRMLGGKTRTPIRLAEDPSERGGATLVLVNAQAATQLQATAGSQLAITVHVAPQTEKRHTYNAIGYLPGSDPKAGTILLTAHLDHLGIGRPVNGDAIYNGANDDAAGTTAVLELAHALAAGPQLKRSVLFVCYGLLFGFIGYLFISLWSGDTILNIIGQNIHQMSLFTPMYAFSYMGFQHNHTLWGYVIGLNGLIKKTTGSPLIEFGTASRLYAVLAVVLFLLVALFVIFSRREQWRKIVALTGCMLVLPYTSFDYTLINWLFAISAYLIYNKSKYSLLYLILILIPFLPVDYILIKNDASISIVIYSATISLAVLFAIFSGKKVRI
jgi:hypothetical protein